MEKIISLIIFVISFFVYGFADNVEAQQCDVCCGAEVQKYLQYVADTICTETNQNECLEPTSYIATRGDGRRVLVNGVFRWRQYPNDTWRDCPDCEERVHLLPHFIREYMEMLRDAYEVCPGFHDQLYNQIDYLVSQRTILPDAPTSQISPTSFMPVLFWENRYGITQGMEQTEMATFLSQAANLYAKHGAKEARETMRYAFQAFESLFLTAGEHTGGVLSEVQDECGAKIARFRKCFWFHSRGVGVDTEDPSHPTKEDRIGTVLNQNLHVIASVLSMYKTVNGVPDLVPKAYGNAQVALARIEDRAIGGLYQLAFSNGNNSAAPKRPPNIAQFMNPLVSDVYGPYYFSWYRFDLTKREFANISAIYTCNYHTHSLAKMKGIKEILDKYFYIFGHTPSGQGWRLYEAVERLFAASNEPMGSPGSTSALWQFWLSHKKKYELTPWVCSLEEDEDCSLCPASDEDEDVTRYYYDVWFHNAWWYNWRPPGRPFNY